MREKVDVTLIVDAIEPQLGGIGRYAWELSQRLPKHPDVSSVRYFAHGRAIDDPAKMLRGEPIYRGKGLVRARRAWRARRALRSGIVHGPNYFLPVGVERGVITVHDLSVFHYPETHPPERIHQFERLFARSLEQAAHIITDTEAIRAELTETFGVPATSVTAVALGVSHDFRPRDKHEIEASLDRFGLQPGRYGLCVSALEPRKKIRELLGAWRRLPRRLRDEFPLVLAGGGGWMNEEIHDDLRDAVAEGWLRHLGFVPEAELPMLYAGAFLFAYPSVYEGFGLPPVEAMASGVPVIVSDRSCLVEVCGDAARYINPNDGDGFLTALQESLEDLRWRKQVIRRGLTRAERFTWDRCVNDTVTVYRHVKLH